MKYKPKTQEIDAVGFGYDEMPRWFIVPMLYDRFVQLYEAA